MPIDVYKRQIVSQVDGDSVAIGPTADYGIYVEFGTGSKGDKSVSHTSKRHWTYYSGGRFYTTSGQAPQPFLVPALKNNISEIKMCIRDRYGIQCKYYYGKWRIRRKRYVCSIVSIFKIYNFFTESQNGANKK